VGQSNKDYQRKSPKRSQKKKTSKFMSKRWGQKTKDKGGSRWGEKLEKDKTRTGRLITPTGSKTGTSNCNKGSPVMKKGRKKYVKKVGRNAKEPSKKTGRSTTGLQSSRLPNQPRKGRTGPAKTEGGGKKKRVRKTYLTVENSKKKNVECRQLGGHEIMWEYKDSRNKATRPYQTGFEKREGEPKHRLSRAIRNWGFKRSAKDIQRWTKGPKKKPGHHQPGTIWWTKKVGAKESPNKEHSNM